MTDRRPIDLSAIIGGIAVAILATGGVFDLTLQIHLGLVGGQKGFIVFGFQVG